jgi:hypothetical protein
MRQQDPIQIARHGTARDAVKSVAFQRVRVILTKHGPAFEVMSHRRRPSTSTRNPDHELPLNVFRIRFRTELPPPPARKARCAFSPRRKKTAQRHRAAAKPAVLRTGKQDCIQMKDLSSHTAPLPRLIRFRDAPRYLGMDRNRFNAEGRGSLTEIRIGVQGVAFDRLEPDAWADQYKARNGRPGQKGV